MSDFGTFRTVPIKNIKQDDRARVDMGDVEELASDIKTRGLIYPVVLDQRLNLCDGGRRLAAYAYLGIDDIPCLIKPGGENINRYELELVGNLHRKDFTWDERVKLVAKIHKMYEGENAKWSARKTAKRLGMSKSLVANHISMASVILDIPQIAECKTEQEANKMLNNLEEELILQELGQRREEKQKDTTDLIARAAEFLNQVKKEKGIPEGEDDTSIIFDGAEEHAEGYDDMPSDVPSNFEEYIHPPQLEDYNVADFFDATKDLPDEFLGEHSIIECDPPYGIDLMNVKKGEHIGHQYEEITADNYPAFLIRLSSDCYRLMGDSSTLIFWFGIQWYKEVFAALTIAGFKVNPVPAIWEKLNFSGQSNKPTHMLSNTYETFFVAKKGDAPLGKKGSSNIFAASPVPPSKKTHPTEKPLTLMRQIITTCCLISPETNCLIPFLGSGVSLIACHSLGISAFGFDLSEKYKNAYLAKLRGDEE